MVFVYLIIFLSDQLSLKKVVFSTPVFTVYSKIPSLVYTKF